MTTLINYRPAADPISKRLNVTMSAATLFLRDGITAVKMTDVASFAGVGVASLYRSFGTKTNLAIAAGTLMWERFNESIRALLYEQRFTGATGGWRLIQLLAHYCDEYQHHPDFVRFLDEFDHVVAAEHVSLEDLADYGKAVDSFYPIFAEAYEAVLADGSITREVDFPVFYRTVAHSMMGIAQRIVRGDIIPSDDFSHGTDELECVVQMARLALGIDE